MDVAFYSDKDLEYAAEFRDGVHREALAILRRTHPGITSVVDRCPVEAYFQQHWDYPGQWYTIVAIPEAFHSRAALIDTIVRDTVAAYRGGAAASAGEDRPREKRSAAQQEKAVCIEPADDPVIGDDPFYERIAAYPDCVLDYCLVRNPHTGRGRSAHRTALSCACRKLFAADDGGMQWTFDVGKADAQPIGADALFTSVYPQDKLNYRRAFLYPPHENRYTGMDFVHVNAALFPNGTDGLEVYEWTTDWSDYFDDGHEWWGALCCTVYDKSLDRFVVILASATD